MDYYIFIWGEFARHIIDLCKNNKTEEFASIFYAIERLHLEGDEYVKEAATIGLLEGIQNHAGHNCVKSSVLDSNKLNSGIASLVYISILFIAILVVGFLPFLAAEIIYGHI